jgi:hypothetical protein
MQPETLAQIKKHQDKVKCWSQFLWIVGVLMVFNSVVSIFFTAIYAITAGYWTTFPTGFKDMHGEQYFISLDKSSLLYTCFAKLLSMVLFYKQGRAAISIFRTIIQEYYQAERGVTQGILMNERRSLKIVEHKKQVKCFTCCHIFLAFTCIPALSSLFTGLADQYIDISFAVKENQHTLVMPIMNDTFSVDPLPNYIDPE